MTLREKIEKLTRYAEFSDGVNEWSEGDYVRLADVLALVADSTANLLPSQEAAMSRLAAMIEPNQQTWDLSPNDVAALHEVHQLVRNQQIDIARLEALVAEGEGEELLRTLITSLTDDLKCTIDLYDRNGPHITTSDGGYLDAEVVLCHVNTIAAIRELLTIKEGSGNG